MEHTIKVVNGRLQFVYDDTLADLLNEGDATVRRVSHVEPHPTRTGWLADMRPVGGPVIGANQSATVLAEDAAGFAKVVDVLLDGFPTRADALQAERDWLARELGL